MELISAAVLQAFDVTYDAPDLNVGLTILDCTLGGAPVQVGAVLAMANVAGSNTYIGYFTPDANKSYLFLKRVYTDNTLTVIDTDYSASSETAFSTIFSTIGNQLTAVQNTLNVLTGQTSSAQFIGLLTGIAYGVNSIGQPQYQRQADIIQGSRQGIIVRLLNAITLDPLDLTGVTEITTCFQNDDGTELMLSLTGGDITVLSAVLGKIQINIGSADTALLAIAEQETLELSFVFGIGVDPIKVQIPDAYNVLQSVC